MLIDLDIGKKAVKHYGAEHQIDICIEECAELIQALCHFKRKRSNQDEICEEIADVCVSILSLRQIFPEILIDTMMEEKAERLMRRIQRSKISA